MSSGGQLETRRHGSLRGGLERRARGVGGGECGREARPCGVPERTKIRVFKSASGLPSGESQLTSFKPQPTSVAPQPTSIGPQPASAPVDWPARGLQPFFLISVQEPPGWDTTLWVPGHTSALSAYMGVAMFQSDPKVLLCRLLSHRHQRPDARYRPLTQHRSSQ